MGPDPALVAYEAFAEVYNEFTHSNDYEQWVGRVLLDELRKHGLESAGRVLDVGCGTGRAFGPLLRRGWEVQGCDLSPAMLEIAANEAPPGMSLSVADMRSLPHLGEFDLVLSLNDSVNYLLGDRDLVHALSGMRRNLAATGLLVFDVNSRSAYAEGYETERRVELKGSQWTWTGRGEVAPNVFAAEITGDRLAIPVRNVERFRPESEVREAMETAGIEVLAALGMSEAGDEIVLSAPLDEDRDYKLVFIGRRAEFRRG